MVAKKSKKSKPKKKPVKNQEPTYGLKERVDQFVEEVEWLSQKWEKKGDKLDKRARKWWYTKFGVFAPLIESLCSIACIIIIGVYLLQFMLDTGALAGFGAEINNLAVSLIWFINRNIVVLFFIALFSSYTRYYKFVAPRLSYVARPATLAINVVIGFWFVAQMLYVIYGGVLNYQSFILSETILANLWNIFILALVLFYTAAIVLHSKKIKKRKKK